MMGSPATCANDMLCGTTIMPMVIPACPGLNLQISDGAHFGREKKVRQAYLQIAREELPEVAEIATKPSQNWEQIEKELCCAGRVESVGAK